MTNTPHNHALSAKGPFVPEPAQRVCARCTEIGLASWWVSNQETEQPILFRPQDDTGTLERLANSASLCALVQEAVANWKADGSYHPRQLDESVWLVAAPIRERQRLLGVVVAIMIGCDAHNSRLFMEQCDASGVGSDASNAFLSTARTADAAQAADVTSVLSWTAQDACELSEAQESVDSLTSHLSESFEEISMLYTLGQTLSDIRHPKLLLNAACSGLAKLGSYEWAAAKFIDEEAEVRSLASTLSIAGTCKHDRGQVRLSADMILDQARASALTDGVATDARTYSTTCGNIVAHPIKRENIVVGVLIASSEDRQQRAYTPHETRIVQSAAMIVSTLVDNAVLYEQQRTTFMGMLEALTAAIDAKDPYTCGHSHRVGMLAYQLAMTAGLSEEEAERIRLAGLVHDIGKIGVPESVLCKSGKLTDDEYQQIRLHPEIGYQILRDIPEMQDLLPGVLYHHERIDGRGYPHGLSGEEIPLQARIIGLVDAFDAMSSARTYRGAMAREKVLEEIWRCSNSQFDSKLVELFMTIDLVEYDRVVAAHPLMGERRGVQLTSLIGEQSQKTEPKRRAA